MEREAHLVTVRSVYGAGFRGSWGHFPELKEEKTKVEVGGAGFWYKKPEWKERKSFFFAFLFLFLFFGKNSVQVW